MPPKSLNKTALGKLTKPVLLELALSMGLVKGKKSILKDEIIQFILNNKSDELTKKFEQLVITKKPENSTVATPHVTFKENIISESLIPSMLSTIVENKPILKVNVLDEAKKCSTFEEIMDLLARYPEYTKNKEIKKIIKNLPDTDTEDLVAEANEPLDNVIDHIPLDNVIERIPLDNVIDHIPLDDVIDHIPLDDVIDHIPLDDVIDHIPLDDVIERTPLDDVLENTPLDALNAVKEIAKKQEFTQPLLKEAPKKRKPMVEQIRDAKEVADILATIKNPSEVHLSILSNVDYDMAKAFGYSM
jgi:hypothetical protein